jgi:hypothetical protein
MPQRRVILMNLQTRLRRIHFLTTRLCINITSMFNNSNNNSSSSNITIITNQAWIKIISMLLEQMATMEIMDIRVP